MRNPSVKVEILDDSVPDVAERLTKSIKASGFKAKIDEIALLAQLLDQCGAKDVYDADRGTYKAFSPKDKWYNRLIKKYL